MDASATASSFSLLWFAMSEGEAVPDGAEVDEKLGREILDDDEYEEGLMDAVRREFFPSNEATRDVGALSEYQSTFTSEPGLSLVFYAQRGLIPLFDYR
ncbi:hypothetical protein KIPB_017194 [Kipferlia bialata]|uniref:Uncharacterized protein n=1 Tax=Kipferlia bialata TaxID=797122 RepID=A0A391NY71_9EUKA|nr:hypothetical protein KIPB_017194 [Kipferlia bialata]|eukprot:g17194.t1